MQKRLSLFVVFFILLGCMLLLESCNSDGGLEYILKLDDTYEVTGYKGKGTDVTIPETYNDKPVTSIGERAFLNCDEITSIVLPNSIIKIEDFAFDNCQSISSIVIPDSVESLGAGVFKYCLKLSSITLGKNIKKIGNNAFVDCKSLFRISIPDSVTSLGRLVFASCEANIYWGNNPGIDRIGDETFMNYLGSSFTIPNTVKSIGNKAFYYCKNLKSIDVPDSVEYIGNQAFYLCQKLSKITIGKNVTTIGDSAFALCNITQATFRDPQGWIVVDNLSDTKGTKVSPNYISLEKYAYYYWKKED